MIGKIFKTQYFYLGVIIFLLSDALLLLFPSLEAYKVSTILKGAVLLYAYVLAYKLFSIKEAQYIFVFFTFFIISQAYLVYHNKIEISGIKENLRFFIWYVFGLLLMLMYKKVYLSISDKSTIRFLNKLTKIIIITICTSIFIGAIFQLDALETYVGKSRWGYKGILRKSVTASYFFILVLSYLYYAQVILKKRYYLFFTVLICSFLCGTKTIYLFSILLLLFHILNKGMYKRKAFWYLSVGLLISLFVFRNFIIKKTEFLWGPFYKIYVERGFIDSFTSFRGEMLTNGIEYYLHNWKALNYIIGGRLLDIKYFEMALFDLICFFGILGAGLFLFIIIKYAIKPFINQTKIIGVFIISTLFLAAFFTGQFFMNSTIVILTYFFMILIQLNIATNEQNKHT